MSKTQRMEKVTGTVYDFGGAPCTVTKNCWKCLGCGRVWFGQYDARDCAGRSHQDSYTKVYANGRVFKTRCMRNECIVRPALDEHGCQTCGLGAQANGGERQCREIACVGCPFWRPVVRP